MADNRPDALGLHMYESLDKETIGELSSKVRGQIIRPHDDGYHQARAVFYGGIDRHPALIIRVADATDVSRAIALARESGLELAVRSGGHSVAGHSTTNGGIILDLSEMKGLEIDLERHTAFAHRGRQIMAAVGAVYERPDEAPMHEEWVSAFAAALSQGDPGVYVNFLCDEGEGRVREAYPGSTWERLAEIKGRYDPTNLFRLYQNIRPTAQD
jgi:FAD/FMN-containing dehydrogenase